MCLYITMTRLSEKKRGGKKTHILEPKETENLVNRTSMDSTCVQCIQNRSFRYIDKIKTNIIFYSPYHSHCIMHSTFLRSLNPHSKNHTQEENCDQLPVYYSNHGHYPVPLEAHEDHHHMDRYQVHQGRHHPISCLKLSLSCKHPIFPSRTW